MQFKAVALSSLALLSSAMAAPTTLQTRDAGWTIENFTRDCTDPNVCTYYFTIDTGSGTQHCTTQDIANPATTHSWYNIPCQEDGDYHISWGWDYNNDFTVMTVVYEPAQLEAFFGYNSPNAVLPVAGYANVGPNAVQSTGVTATALA